MKVQIDVTGTRALIYNEDHSVWYETDLKQGDGLLMIMPTPYPCKMYMNAELQDDGNIDLREFVEDQVW